MQIVGKFKQPNAGNNVGVWRGHKLEINYHAIVATSFQNGNLVSVVLSPQENPTSYGQGWRVNTQAMSITLACDDNGNFSTQIDKYKSNALFIFKLLSPTGAKLEVADTFPNNVTQIPEEVPDDAGMERINDEGEDTSPIGGNEEENLNFDNQDDSRQNDTSPIGGGDNVIIPDNRNNSGTSIIENSGNVETPSGLRTPTTIPPLTEGRNISAREVDAVDTNVYANYMAFTAANIPTSLIFEAYPEIPSPLQPPINVQANQKLKGKIVDVEGITTLRNIQVIFWNKVSATERYPIAVVRTDSTGNFSTQIAKRTYTSVVATVGEQDNIEILVELTNSGNISEFTYLIVSNYPTHFGEEEDCACNDQVPLPGDASDLTEANYQQDIGKNCVNFTKPNRVLEEFDFYSVVRTTEPDIRGIMLGANANSRISNSSAIDISNYQTRAILGANNQADWDETPTIYQTISVAHGHLLHYKQQFKAAGYSLGDFFLRFSLAFCGIGYAQYSQKRHTFSSIRA